MPSSTRQILTQRFGLRVLRPVQKDVIERLLGGGHALVVMPTGSGKSLCYQLPAVALPQPGVTLVFSPLIALMEDQVSALKARGIRAEYINSTLSKRERERRAAELARGEYELIYATPERMRKPEFLEALQQVPGGVKLLAIDEAHCIARWGHDLRPAYREIGRFRRQLGRPGTIALTATATRRVRDEIRRTLGLSPEDMPLFSTPIARPNLALQAAEVWHDDDKIQHIRDIANPRGRARGTGIVYFARIKDLDHFAGALREVLGRRTIEIYHGQLTAREKKRVYQRFIEAKPEDALLLLATNAFGMGVDKPDIRFIIHAQVPGNVEAYFQEVGRAGRDGRKARCMLLYSSDDLAIQHQFIDWANPSADLLVRTAHAIETCPHADIDVDEVQVLVAGKARQIARGVLEHALISLDKRGIIDPCSATFRRYRFARPLEHGEVDPAAIERKKKRDLHRLHDMVKLFKCSDIAAFITRYFDLSEEARPARQRRRPARQASKDAARTASASGRRRRRRRRPAKAAGHTATQAAEQPAAQPPTGDGSATPARKRRRRRRSQRSTAAEQPVQETAAPRRRRRRRPRRRAASQAAEAAQPQSQAQSQSQAPPGAAGGVAGAAGDAEPKRSPRDDLPRCLIQCRRCGRRGAATETRSPD